MSSVTMRQLIVCRHTHARTHDQDLCLDSVVTVDGGAIQDVKARMKKANAIFVGLCLLWKNKYTGHTQKNGAISSVNVYNMHHSFVYALYVDEDIYLIVMLNQYCCTGAKRGK